MPKISRRIHPTQLGHLVDQYIRLVVSQSNPDFQLSLLQAAEHVLGQEELLAHLLNELEYFQTIGRFVQKKLPASITIEPEWTHGLLQGHPDLVTEDTIYDIKMTPLFGRMRIATIFQLLSYYALNWVQQPQTRIRYIGVVLPAQQIVERVDVSGWDPSGFLSVLHTAAEAKNVLRQELLDFQQLFATEIGPYFGSHITRLSSLYRTVQELPGRPKQIYLAGRVGSRRTFKFSERDYRRTAEFIATTPDTLFIHGALAIKIASSEEWVIQALEKEFQSAVAMGASGVVIHLGQRAGQDEEVAKQNMRDHVEIVARKFATTDCPLLLETDSGGSLYDDPRDLATFYESLDDDIRSHVGICHDTCHVFAAGYDNLETLRMFKSRNIPVRLIHYNDSKHEQGTKLDRHAAIGHGMIGLRRLYAIGQWAIQHGIPLVGE